MWQRLSGSLCRRGGCRSYRGAVVGVTVEIVEGTVVVTVAEEGLVVVGLHVGMTISVAVVGFTVNVAVGEAVV